MDEVTLNRLTRNTFRLLAAGDRAVEAAAIDFAWVPQRVCVESWTKKTMPL